MTITSSKLFTAFHNLYLAYYYRSKGLGIESERMSLASVYGDSRSLSSYFKLVASDFNDLSNRSRDAFYVKWERTFGEDLQVAYDHMRDLNRQHISAGCAPASTSVLDAAEIVGDVSSDCDEFNPFLALELDALTSEVSTTLALIDAHPSYTALPTTILRDLDAVKDFVAGRTQFPTLTAGCPCDPQSVIDAVVVVENQITPTKPSTSSTWKRLSHALHVRSMKATIQREDLENQKAIDLVLSQGPIQIGSRASVVDVPENPEDLSFSIDSASTVACGVDDVDDSNSFMDDSDIDHDLPGDDHIMLDGTQIAANFNYQISLAMNAPPVEAPAGVRPADIIPVVHDANWHMAVVSNDLGLDSRDNSSDGLYVSSPASADNYSYYTNSRNTDHFRYIRKKLAKQAATQAITYMRQRRERRLANDIEEYDDDDLDLSGITPPGPSLPTNTGDLGLSISVSTFNDEVNFESWCSVYPVQASLDTYVNPTSPLGLYSYDNWGLTEPIPLPTQDAEEAPEPSIEPRIPTPSPEPPKLTIRKLKAAAEPVLERRHWPDDTNDRKGMYIFMLYSYVPMCDDLLFCIYSYICPETIDAKRYNQQAAQIKTDLRSLLVETDNTHLQPPALNSGPNVRYNRFIGIYHDASRTMSDFHKVWLNARKFILEPSNFYKEEEIVETLAEFRRKVNKLRKRYRALTMRAAAEPTLEKRNDKDDDGMAGCSLVIGNQEQYIDENGLSDGDFAGDTLSEAGSITEVVVPLLVPIVTVPVVWACPEARTVVRMSREPQKPLPSLPDDVGDLGSDSEDEVDLTFVGGMHGLVPNIKGKSQKKVRRGAPSVPDDDDAFTRSSTFTLPTSNLGELAPLEQTIADLPALSNEQLQYVINRIRRREDQRAVQRQAVRAQFGLVRRMPSIRPASADDQIRPMSPEPLELPELAPEPEIEPRFPGQNVIHFDRPQNISGIHADFGRVPDEQDELAEYFGEDDFGVQNVGWTVQFGKTMKPVVFEEDPETGRMRAPERKKIGRPKLFGPELPPHMKRARGRPKGSKNIPKTTIRRGFSLNELGEPVYGEIESAEPAEEEFDPFATLPSVNVPVGVDPREFRRRARMLEKNLIRIRRDRAPGRMQLMLERAQALNEPGLSNHITQIYRRSTEIQNGKRLTFLGLKFNMMQRIDRLASNVGDLGSAAVLGPLQMFQRQTLNLQNYVRNVVDREVVMWRIILIYNTDQGQHVTSTTWTGDYQRTYNQIQLKIANTIAQYGEDGVNITNFEVRVRYHKQMLIGGLTDKQYLTKFGELEREWVVVNPRSRTNCLWTAVAIASGFRANDQLMYSSKIQNQSGLNLKRRVGTRNPKGGTDEDLQKCSTHKSMTIIVHDLAGLELGRFQPRGPTASVGDMHILLNMAHYHAMLPKSDPIVQQHITAGDFEEVKKRELTVIKQCTKDFEPRRIVVYDLESYRAPKDEVNPDLEVDQIAYAVGWGFETKDIGEMKQAEDQGYQIVEADMNYAGEVRKMFMAYKRELGDGCLDIALHEWLHNPILDGSVVYAHNGGKFDLRLIMGQSNLLYADMYVIQPDKLIDLNGRIINMDVENIFQRYSKTVEKKGKETAVEWNHHISIRDSIPLFGPASGLAKLTEELDVPHKKMKELLNVHDLQNKDTWHENWIKYDMDKYLLYDVCGLLEVLTKFNSEVMEGTQIPITAVNTGASLSKKYFLKHHYHNTSNLVVGDQTKAVLDPSKSIYCLDPEMDAFIRNGYGGGRCESFICGEKREKVYYYDFTSLYPDVGRLPMPIGQPKWICRPEEQDEKAFQDRVERQWQSRVIDGNRFGTTAYWQVRIRSKGAAEDNMTDPLHRKPLFGMKEEGMYTFRWMKDWQVMTIYEEEILYAMEHGLDYEFEPINGIVFEKGVILKDCMEQLFIKKAQAKADGKPGLAQSWKVIINSLYGVWGLKVLAREGIEIARPEHSNWAIDMVTEKLMDLEKIGKYIITRRLKDLEVKDCNVALAAAVTSEARMKLYSLMMDIQDRGGEVYYCDTDSIQTNFCIEEDPVMYAKWIGPSNGKDLGSLKNEIEECYEKWNNKHPEDQLTPKHYFTEAIIVAPKMYILTAEDGKLLKKAHKGYRENKEAGDLVTYERMKKLIDEDIPEAERLLEQDTYQWLGGNADILKNQIGVRIVKRHKKIAGLRADGHPINKGILQEDGRIFPFIQKTARRKIRRSM